MTVPATAFTRRFTAAAEDIDELGHVNNAVWVQWMEAMKEAAEATLPDDKVFTDNMISAMASMSKSMAANAGQKDDHP